MEAHLEALRPVKYALALLHGWQLAPPCGSKCSAKAQCAGLGLGRAAGMHAVGGSSLKAKMVTSAFHAPQTGAAPIPHGVQKARSESTSFGQDRGALPECMLPECALLEASMVSRSCCSCSTASQHTPF